MREQLHPAIECAAQKCEWILCEQLRFQRKVVFEDIQCLPKPCFVFACRFEDFHSGYFIPNPSELDPQTLDYREGNHLRKSCQFQRLRKPISITPSVQLQGINMLTEPRRSSEAGMGIASEAAVAILASR